MAFTEGEIQSLCAAETERVEWKQSSKDGAEVLHAVAAMANDLGDRGTPGFVLLGVDKAGRPVGHDVADEAILRLTHQLTSSKILPHPSCEVVPVKHDGKDFIVIRVEPYPVPPVVKVNAVAYVRVGTMTKRASDADLLRLEERRPEGALPFDLRSVQTESLDGLDLATLRQYHAAAQSGDIDPETFPTLERWLRQENVVRGTEARWFPTVMGLLVYGINPQTAFPGATIELVRYSGTGLDAPVLLRKTITGCITHQLDALWAQLDALNVDVPATERTTGIRESFAPTYPPEALKELARNLVQHRAYDATRAPARVSWFDDRVVFNNPGGPYGQAAQGEFGSQSDYRNPTITSHLVKLGYVQKLGRGVGVVRLQLERNGNPPLQVETDGFTTITVRRRP